MAQKELEDDSNMQYKRYVLLTDVEVEKLLRIMVTNATSHVEKCTSSDRFTNHRRNITNVCNNGSIPHDTNTRVHNSADA